MTLPLLKAASNTKTDSCFFLFITGDTHERSLAMTLEFQLHVEDVVYHELLSPTEMGMAQP